MRRTIIAIAFALLLPLHANAWNARGHQFVADVAEQLLTDRAREVVGQLLKSQGKEHLRDVAAWADQIRALGFFKQPSHAVRIPWDESYSAKSDCPKRECALGALQISAKTLSNTKTNDAARAVALNYVVHLVGDIHQPLHVSTNKAFAAVKFEGERRSLHEMWDRDIADAAIARPSCGGVLATNTDYQPADLWQWVEEVHSIAYDVFTELSGYPKDGDLSSIPSDYVDAQSGLACQLLNAAGVRLALVLNTALDDVPRD